MKKEDIDTLILSDIHFGSELCNAELLFEVMSKFRFKRLILNGDIFDHLNLEFEVKTRHLRDGQVPRAKKHRLKKSHLGALSFISGLSKPENDCEVVWIEGNHDEGISHIFSSLIGATVYNEYLWEFAGKKCLAVHGDQFDEFYRDHLNLVEWATWLYQVLQSFGPKAYPLCLYLKDNSKHYARALNIVAEGAAKYAAKKVYRKIENLVAFTVPRPKACGWSERFHFARNVTAVPLGDGYDSKSSQTSES